MARETIKSLKTRITELETVVKKKKEELLNILQQIINAVIKSDELNERIRDEVDEAVSNLSIS